MAPALGQKQRARIGHLGQAAISHFEHADLVGGAEPVLGAAQDAELVAAIAFEMQHRIHHVLQHTRACQGALFRHVPHQNQAEAALLGQPDQFEPRRPHLRHGARRALHGVQPHGLDRIDHHHGEVALAFQCGHNVAHVNGGGQLHRRLMQAQPARPQPDLVHRLFTGDIEYSVPRLGQGRGRLEQERGFADARIPPHQNGRGCDQAPAQHPVQLAYARHPARRRLRGA